MIQYIPKAAVVAEIEKRIKEREEEEKKGWAYSSVKIVECEHFLSFIDTLEVKEVDLEEDINDFINEEYHYTEYDGKWVDEKDWRDSIQRCAKHFFELGIKAKGE